MSEINLNKYANDAAYNADTRPANERCVSLVGDELVYDGVNLIMKRNQLKHDDVCLVFWDNVDNEYAFVPVETYVASKFDTTRYTVQDFVRFTQSFGKDVVIHKTEGTKSIAEYNRYKLECDTTAAGGFHWAITINGTAKSGDVTWAVNDTLDSIVTQLNTGAVARYLVFKHNSGENFIRITTGGRTDDTFTLTNNTGTTITDLSLYTKVGGVQQPEVHRTWQSQDVRELFPNSGFIPANTKLYARNGYNLPNVCGGNLTKFKEYITANGSSSYVAEKSTNVRMKPTAFNSLNGSGVAAQQALYDKYNGSWDAYMEAQMVKIDDTHTDGSEYQSYDNGDTQNDFLASVTTMDFDGSYIPAYPAAAAAASITDSRLGPFHMPTVHEIAVFMEDSVMAKINSAMSIINGTTLSYNETYICLMNKTYGDGWIYYSTYGTIASSGRFFNCKIRLINYIS